MISNRMAASSWAPRRPATWQSGIGTASLPHDMGSLIKKRRKRMRKKKHKKMLKATRWQRRAGK
jgi:hypothetical protein